MAWTDRIEFWSTSKVTSIWGVPLGAGGMPVKSNLPNKWLSFVSGLSPSKTWMVTVYWLSWYVVKTWDFLVGIYDPFGIILLITPPTVSIPSDKGVASIITIPPSSVSYPQITPPWTAAPKQMASSGLIPVFGSLPPKNSLTNCLILGILVDPPTKTI